MNQPLSMAEAALLISKFDAELRSALQHARSGVFRNASGKLYVRSDVPLGQSYPAEVLGIFADESDLDFFYKIYLKTDPNA